MNPPWREVPYTTPNDVEETHTNKIVFPVMVTAAEDPSPDPESILTRESDPYKAERVAKIVQEVTIGQDVTVLPQGRRQRRPSTMADKETEAETTRSHRCSRRGGRK